MTAGMGSSNNDEYEKYTLNLSLLKRLKMVLKILFPGFKSLTFLILASVIMTRVFCEFVGYYSGLLPSLFIKRLVEKDKYGVIHMIIVSVILVFIHSSGESLSLYTKNCLIISWRQLLNNQIHRMYFASENFYKLNVSVCKLDNTDQRITQDVDKMCRAFINVVSRTIMFPGILIFYSYKAYTTVGLYAIIGSYIFIILSAIINISLTAPIVKATTELEKCEGDYRFQHAGVRLNSEAIAFQRSQFFEWRKVSEKLNKLCFVLQKVNNRTCVTKFSVVAFNMFQTVAAYVVLSIAFLKGDFDGMSDADFSALIVANHFYMSYLNSAFSDLVSQYENISQVAGTLHRIGELLEEMDDKSEINTDKEFESSFDKSMEFSLLQDNEDSIFCEMKDVTVGPPNDQNKIILKNVSYKFKIGENVLINGEESCGKTTIFRLIRGLWKERAGKIFRSKMIDLGPSSVYFQPQTVLLSCGSLTDQIHFPFNDSSQVDIDDEIRIRKYLIMMGLEKFISLHGPDGTFKDDWNVVMSPYEKKLIALTRILYHKPKIVIIDNIFNALVNDKIETFFLEGQKLGMTFITVGDKNLRPYHTKEIFLNKNFD